MGCSALELARRVGASGRVIAADLQPSMIDALRRRAARAGLSERIDSRLTAPQTMGAEWSGGRGRLYAGVRGSARHAGCACVIG
jgi:predicted O-methyltransferase YrrM